MNRSLASVATGLAALALALAPAAMPTTASGSPAAPAPGDAARTTLVTLHVDGCKDRCEVQLVQAFEGRTYVWSSKRKNTTDGVVRFRVPSRRTTGMSIELTPPWHRQNYFPVVAVHYAGMSDGERVSAREAASSRRAYGCLEGTRRPRLRLDIQVDRFRSRGVTGDIVDTARVYSEETLPALAPLKRTLRGSLGGQEALYCER
jgi:hypothetical protein